MFGLLLCLFCDEGIAQAKEGKQPGSNTAKTQRLPMDVTGLTATVTPIAGGQKGVEQLVSSTDAGDSYETPAGKRRLLRMAGVLAIRAPVPSDISPLIQRITKSGELLEGYEETMETADWIVLKAPQKELERQIKNKDTQFEVVTQLRGQLREIVNPVFVDPNSGLSLVVSERVIIRLKPGVDAPTYFGAQWAAVRPLPGTSDQFVLTLAGFTAEQVLTDVNTRMADDRVMWAEPDFLMEVVRHFTPNDTYYSSQWNLHNTGQGGGIADADIDAPEAWDTTRGSSAVGRRNIYSVKEVS